MILRGDAAAREEARLVAARELDAEEVGRRADERRRQREAAADSAEPPRG